MPKIAMPKKHRTVSKKVKAHGETLVVARGARLRPVDQFLHLAEKAKKEELARRARD